MTTADLARVVLVRADGTTDYAARGTLGAQLATLLDDVNAGDATATASIRCAIDDDRDRRCPRPACLALDVVILVLDRAGYSVRIIVERAPL